MITAGSRDHAGWRHIAHQQIREGAARLEGTGMLQELQLKDDSGGV